MMQLKINNEGTIIDLRTNDTLLVTGVALPCSHRQVAFDNANYIVECVNNYPRLLEKEKLLDELMEITQEMLKNRKDFHQKMTEFFDKM